MVSPEHAADYRHAVLLRVPAVFGARAVRDRSGQLGVRESQRPRMGAAYTYNYCAAASLELPGAERIRRLGGHCELRRLCDRTA